MEELTLTERYLAHHGILGQKWGDRNGPPYPLGASDHSASERKAGWKKSLDGGSQQDTNKDKTKSVNENNKSAKYSKEDIDKHRQEMISEFEKKGYSNSAKLYKEASDEMIAQDLKNKDDMKKVLIGLAAVAGVATASYLCYKVYQNKSLAATLIKNPDLKTLVDNGLSISTAGDVLKVNAKHKLLDSDTIYEIMKAANADLDIVIKNAQFARADYRDDFSLDKANKLLYLAMGEWDAGKYQQILPNRHSNSATDKIKQYLINALDGKDITLPSLKKADGILKDLAAKDPQFAKELDASWIRMARGNLEKIYGKKFASMFSDLQLLKDIENVSNGQFGKRGNEYFLNGGLGGDNQYITDQVIKAFTEKGYDGLFDTHDILDRVSKAPVIMFNTEKSRGETFVTKLLKK